MANKLPIKEKIESLKGNAALFIPIKALGEFAKDLTTHQQATLNRAINNLSEKYYFLGELMMESATHSPELLQNKPRGFHLIRNIMQANGFDAGYLQNWNIESELKEARIKSLTGKSGTGRRDIIRELLLTTFATPDIQTGLRTYQTAELQKDKHEGKSILFAFNTPAQTKEYFVSKHDKTEPALAKTVDYSVKRALVRAYLQSLKSAIPTEDAIADYTDDRAVKIIEHGGILRVRVPLDDEIYARINKGRLKTPEITRAVGSEIIMGIRTVQQAQPTLPKP